jgi:hypothetical protein
VECVLEWNTLLASHVQSLGCEEELQWAFHRIHTRWHLLVSAAQCAHCLTSGPTSTATSVVRTRTTRTNAATGVTASAVGAQRAAALLYLGLHGRPPNLPSAFFYSTLLYLLCLLALRFSPSPSPSSRFCRAALRQPARVCTPRARASLRSSSHASSSSSLLHLYQLAAHYIERIVLRT